jgi:hypothetical protein
MTKLNPLDFINASRRIGFEYKSILSKTNCKCNEFHCTCDLQNIESIKIVSFNDFDVVFSIRNSWASEWDLVDTQGILPEEIEELIR